MHSSTIARRADGLLASCQREGGGCAPSEHVSASITTIFLRLQVEMLWCCLCSASLLSIWYETLCRVETWKRRRDQSALICGSKMKKNRERENDFMCRFSSGGQQSSSQCILFQCWNLARYSTFYPKWYFIHSHTDERAIKGIQYLGQIPSFLPLLSHSCSNMLNKSSWSFSAHACTCCNRKRQGRMTQHQRNYSLNS